MNNINWALDNENRILYLLRAEIEQDVIALFPKAFFTTENEANTTRFPTISFSEIGSPESGQTLDEDGINAISSTIQIQIIINTKKSDTKKIAKLIVKAMKKLHYTSLTGPVFQDINNLHFCNLRFVRSIGDNDIL